MSIRGKGRKETFRSLREGGPVSLREHASKKHEGEIMRIAKSPVITVAPTTPVFDAVKIMNEKGFRRIPVTDPGTKKLLGIITAVDIVNYLGGGEKFQIIKQRHGGNFYKAIYEHIKAIMTPNVVSVPITGKINDAIEAMRKHNVGGLPVVDEEGRVWAIVTERDIAFLFTGKLSGTKVEGIMSHNVITATPGMSIFNVEKTMIERGFRRLPIVSEGKLVGIVTVMDILKFFGTSRVFEHLRSGTITQILRTPVIEIATIERIISIDPHADLGQAARLMKENNVGALPVIENEKLVGIITERDFFKAVL